MNADTSCQPIYGGGQTCEQVGNISVNKTVLNPKTNTFVDNLDVNDVKFSPDQTINFKINITNTGSAKLNKISLRDVFPQFVNFVSGTGNFEASMKLLSFTIDGLNPNETKTFDIQGKVAPNDQLPNDKGIVCVVNQAVATVEGTGQVSQDNSQFCIQKTVLTAETTTKGGLKVFPQPTITTTPSTGPEMWSLLGLIPTGTLGYFLRKKSLIKNKKNLSA
ncbi:MAG: DUF11 domain-containing protein [Actinobacteria bacterium]|nr:DUF11 domain-containing protein [Actinomycetota bacterium]